MSDVCLASSQVLCDTQRWDELLARGFVAAAVLADDVSVACLNGWCRTAAADLELAEALRGRPIEPDEQLSQALTAAATKDTENSGWVLNRYAGCFRCNSKLPIIG